MIQIIAAPQSHDGIHGKIGKVVFFVGEKFRTEGGAGDAEEVVAEEFIGVGVVDGGGFEG